MANRSKEKNRIYQHEWYLRNRALQIKRNQENKDRKVAWYRDYKKDLACKICGENHPAIIEFHHREPEKKEKDIAALVFSNCSIEKILEEINKCDVLCANCHRKLHYDLKNGSVLDGIEDRPSCSEKHSK